MKELALVMPVYNEEEILENVINDWTNVFEGLDIDFEILAYNDGSKDKSLEILRKNAENNSRLIVRDKKILVTVLQFCKVTGIVPKITNGFFKQIPTTNLAQKALLNCGKTVVITTF